MRTDPRERLAHIYERIAKACLLAGRSPHDVTLLTVTKGQGMQAIADFLALGCKDFGENRAAEAFAKWGNKPKGVLLHYIGPLTSRFVEVASYFDVVHSLANAKALDGLLRAKQKDSLLPELYVQVNIGKEPQKLGVMPEGLAPFLQLCHEKGIFPAGLMCIPPRELPARPFFEQMQELAARNRLNKLSMGMSDDFEEAISCGATCIRLGRAMF